MRESLEESVVPMNSVGPKVRSMVVLVLAFAVSPFSCPGRSHDYMFDVTGIVTAEDGTPIKDADVTLEVNGPVYEAVTLVRTAKRSTDGTGGFVFVYISHKRGVKYSLNVRKDGFEPQTVSGSAPRAGHHTIRIKKAGD
jgi:Carboxypeptidase regulatory-like domain